MRRLLRPLSTVLIVSGVLMLADAALTLAWQEPVSALYARLQQNELEAQLHKLELQGPTPAELTALLRLKSDPKRIAFLARAQRRKTTDGDAIGRIKIPELGTNFVVVEGTEPADLRKGPGRYADSSLPGLGGTVAVAGHRTTYLAPFRTIDQLSDRDEIVMEMPYGRFTYRVFDSKIVKPDAYYVTETTRGDDRLVLTACHPLYSAQKRIVVFARLVRSEPRGAALKD